MKCILTTERRDGKIAIWVECGASRMKIWDLPEKMITEDVLNALASAVGRGALLQSEQMRKVINECNTVEVKL